MIQRIQTVYLALGVGLLAATWWGVGLDEAPATTLPWFFPVAATVFGLTALAALAAVFLYGNRERQRRVALVAQFLAVGSALVVFLGQNLSGSLPTTASGGTPSAIALALPLVAYVLFRLARRGIEKDIRLIRSVDRLRG